MKRLFSVLSFALLLPLVSSAQMDFKQIVPANPNVASLFKSTITPVNEYSGLPNVSIPLCTATEGNISVPVSLSYHTGGIQVSEESGVVGLGWSLNVGGAITRTINGVDDFASTYGYLVHTKQAPDITLINPDVPPFVDADANCEFLVNGVLTYFAPPEGEVLEYDFMPDTFYFNFNGYSGSFMFDDNGDIFLLEKNGLEIVQQGTGPLSTTFKITTEDGTLYEFTLRGETSFPNGNVDTYTSTWYLTTITDISGNQVFLDYKTKDDSNADLVTQPLRSFNQSFETPTYSGTDSASQNGRIYYNSKGPKTVIDDFYLDKITFDSGEIQFDYSADDIRSDVKGYYLESVKLMNNDSTVVKDFDFTYSYFGSHFGKNSNNYNSVSVANGDFAQTIGALDTDYPDINQRLRLDGVTENDIKEHTFEYFDNSVMPNKTSFSQDYWGFYNNAPNYETFIPELRDSIGDPLSYSQFTKADRLPKEDFAKYFSLKKITYPTQGSTEFDYELNTYDANGNTNNPYPTTVQKYVPVYANEVSVYNYDSITPYQNSTLYLDYTVTLRGWNSQYSKPTLTTNDFQNKFYVAFKDMNGNIISKQHIDSSDGYNQWIAFTDQQNSSMQAVIAFSVSEEWKYSNPITQYDLTDSEYIIEAYFDDLGGKLYGQATVTARWEDVEVDPTKQYSIGGGLRIKSVIDKDSDGSVATQRDYNYHYTEIVDSVAVEKSYGRIKTIPKYSEDHRTAYLMKHIFTLQASSYYALQGLPKIAGSASSQNSFSKDAGSYAGYDQVEITYEGQNGDNGKTIKKYHNQEDYFSEGLSSVSYRDDYHKFPPLRVPHNGYLQKVENYKRTGASTYVKINETENEYKINGLSTTGFNIYSLYQNTDQMLSGVKEKPITMHLESGGGIPDCGSFKFQYHTFFSDLVQQTGVTETLYDQDGLNPVATAQEFFYDNDVHLLRTRSKITESDGSVVETEVFFPDDITSSTSLQEGGTLQSYNLVDQLKSDDLYRIATPIQTVVKRDTTVLSVQRTEFASFDGIILPNKTLTAKGGSLEERLIYEDYVDGRPVQLRKGDGSSIIYIWGYDGAYPIAKVENATYSDIATALSITVSALKAYDETNLSNINGLRSSNPEFMVTTYTYEPLVGVTTITDPKGYTSSYDYDELNRLKSVKDDLDHIIGDYQYHYMGQQ